MRLFIMLPVILLLMGCSTIPQYDGRCLILEHERRISEGVITCPPRTIHLTWICGTLGIKNLLINEKGEELE